MGDVIAQGTSVAGSRWAVEAAGPWLDLLKTQQGVKARNSILRWSLVEMGYVWAGRFLGRRFTNYVRPAPFFYKLSFNNTVKKFRRMGLLDPIIKSELYGWDPWGSESPPRQLIDAYRRQNPEARGAFSRSGNFFTLSKTIRKHSKEIIRRYVSSIQYTQLRPLVETGTAERTALAGHRVTATASQTKCAVRITVPFGAARNAVVGKIVRTVPPAEVAFMASVLGPILGKRLARSGVSAPGPMPVQRGVNAGGRAS